MLGNEKIQAKFATARSILETVYLDDLKEINIHKQLEVLKQLDRRKRDKGVALFEIVKKLSPEFVNSAIASAVSYKTDFLPFSREDFKFRGKIGEGGMNDVFLADHFSGPFALEFRA